MRRGGPAYVEKLIPLSQNRAPAPSGRSVTGAVARQAAGERERFHSSKRGLVPWCRTLASRCYTDRVPTTKPRYTFTDTGHLNELLNAAARRWPETTDRKELLLRLAREGHDALRLGELDQSADQRREQAWAALERIPALVDAGLLLSDRAWE